MIVLPDRICLAYEDIVLSSWDAHPKSTLCVKAGLGFDRQSQSTTTILK